MRVVSTTPTGFAILLPPISNCTRYDGQKIDISRVDRPPRYQARTSELLYLDYTGRAEFA